MRGIFPKLMMMMRCFARFQVLQYNDKTQTWSEIGKLENARQYHAIAEANLRLVCFGIGNLNPKRIIIVVVVVKSWKD